MAWSPLERLACTECKPWQTIPPARRQLHAVVAISARVKHATAVAQAARIASAWRATVPIASAIAAHPKHAARSRIVVTNNRPMCRPGDPCTEPTSPPGPNQGRGGLRELCVPESNQWRSLGSQGYPRLESTVAVSTRSRTVGLQIDFTPCLPCDLFPIYPCEFTASLANLSGGDAGSVCRNGSAHRGTTDRRLGARQPAGPGAASSSTRRPRRAGPGTRTGAHRASAAGPAPAG